MGETHSSVAAPESVTAGQPQQHASQGLGSSGIKVDLQPGIDRSRTTGFRHRRPQSLGARPVVHPGPLNAQRSSAALALSTAARALTLDDAALSPARWRWLRTPRREAPMRIPRSRSSPWIRHSLGLGSPRHLVDQRREPGIDRRPTDPVAIGPPPADQPPVSGQERVWQATTSLRTRRSTTALRHRVVSRSAGRTKDAG
jgi:hypothetical protein